MKILITGGTGFVGKHFQQELKRLGTDFAVFSKAQYDLTDGRQAQAVFSENRDADAIIHLASYQAAGTFPAEHPAEQFHVNSLIHVNTLDAWRPFLPHARLIAVGSSCAYPSESPLTEDQFCQGEIHGSVYSYAFTKRLLYKGITAYNDQFGLNGSYVIPATMFGEHDDFHEDTAHVCGALIGKFVRAARNDDPQVEVWGDGTQVRDFMDVKAFVRAVIDLLPRCDRELVNIGPGRGTSIRDLAFMIAEAAGYRRDIRFNAERYVGVQHKVIDVSRFNSKYNLQIDSDHRDGIARTVAWYDAHYDQLVGKRKFESDQSKRAA